MAERNWYDDVMGFFGQDSESVIEGRTPSVVDGKIKAGFGDFLAGRSTAELNAAYDKYQNTQERKAGETAVKNSGYTTELIAKGIDPKNTTKGAVVSAVRQIQEGNTKKADDTAFERSMAPLYLKMADEKDARAAELQYQKMRDRRTDLEYNERMERLDRKDRQAMMQNLAAGLASLGAAFAL